MRFCYATRDERSVSKRSHLFAGLMIGGIISAVAPQAVAATRPDFSGVWEMKFREYVRTDKDTVPPLRPKAMAQYLERVKALKAGHQIPDAHGDGTDHLGTPAPHLRGGEPPQELVGCGVIDLQQVPGGAGDCLRPREGEGRAGDGAFGCHVSDRPGRRGGGGPRRQPEETQHGNEREGQSADFRASSASSHCFPPGV